MTEGPESPGMKASLANSTFCDRKHASPILPGQASSVPWSPLRTVGKAASQLSLATTKRRDDWSSQALEKTAIGTGIGKVLVTSENRPQVSRKVVLTNTWDNSFYLLKNHFNPEVLTRQLRRASDSLSALSRLSWFLHYRKQNNAPRPQMRSGLFRAVGP